MSPGGFFRKTKRPEREANRHLTLRMLVVLPLLCHTLLWRVAYLSTGTTLILMCTKELKNTKVKLALKQAIKAQIGSKGVALLFL